jgi:hypothetical protein
VTRGILVDIARMKGLQKLEPGTHIYKEDIEAVVHPVPETARHRAVLAATPPTSRSAFRVSRSLFTRSSWFRSG